MINSSSAPMNGPSGSHKRHVRNYLLDSRFQLKYAGILVLVAIGISSVMGTVLYSTTRSMVAESAKVIEQSQKTAEESKKVSSVTRMNVHDLAAESPELVAEFERQADAYDRSIAEQEKAVAAQQSSLIDRQRRVIVSLVGGLTLMVVAIGLFGIYFTHKVAGPVYKMKRLLKQVGDGNLQVEARLRKGDELQSFFDSFTRMVAGLRELEKQHLDGIENALEALERGDDRDVGAALQRVRRAIRTAMGA
jgi:nitrogen fixation/metabolism regulation signal transduction histidine kinase